MERITDPVDLRDYNEDYDIALRLFRQPGLTQADLSFSVYDADNSVPILRARKNTLLFGDGTTAEDKYIYARTGAAQEPFIKYNVTSGKWEIYPAPSGGGGAEPILAAHKILQADVHTDTESGDPVQGDLIVANATPKWARFPKGAANQILGVQASGATLEWKNIISLLAAGAGISISGSTVATITNTGVLSVNAMAGAVSIVGTTNQVNVSSGGGTVTLSLPQNIHTSAAPTFGGLILGSTAKRVGSTGIFIGLEHIASYIEFLTSAYDVGYGAKIYGVDSGGGVTSVRLAVRGQSVSWTDAITVLAQNGAGNGWVGIGISPTSRLDVNGQITIRGGTPAVGKILRCSSATGLAEWSNLKRMLVFPIPGNPAAGAPVSVRIVAPTSGTITAVKHICTVAASTTYTYDINKNGTTIYTTQSNRPQRTSAHGTSLITAAMPDVTSIAAGDVFEIDLDVQGTGVKDVVFFIEYVET
jgi:hypothetical protein